MRDAALTQGRLGRYDLAETLLHDAEVLIGGAGDPLTQAGVLKNLGTVQLLQDRPDEALATLRRAVQVAEATGSDQLLASVHASICEVHHSRGDMEATYAGWTTTLDFARRAAISGHDVVHRPT